MSDSAEILEVKGFDAYPMRLGDIMRGERATMGKSLLDVQRDLRIRAAYIAAIENCDASAFTTPGFIAGYVRSYARYLGLDPEETFQQFCVESGFDGVHAGARRMAVSTSQQGKRTDNQGKGAVITPIRRESEPFLGPGAGFAATAGGDGLFSDLPLPALGSILVLVALILGLGYGAWSMLQDIQRVQIAPVQDQPFIVTDGASGGANGLPVGTGGDTQRAAEQALIPAGGTDPAMARSAAGQGNMTAGVSQVYRARELQVPVMTPRDGPISALDPARIGALVANNGGRQASEAAQNLEETTPKVTEVAPPRVAVVARRPAWVRISRKDGTVLFERILDGGESFLLPADDSSLRLRAGNSGDVYLSVDGQPYGPVGKGGSVAKNVVLTPNAIAQKFSRVSDRKALAALDSPRVITMNDRPAKR